MGPSRQRRTGTSGERRRGSGRGSAAAAGPGDAATAARANRRPLLWLAGVVLLVVGLYAPVRDYPFISMDDPMYVSQNSHVAAGMTWAGAAWVFTAAHGGFWHPVTGLSHMLDVALFGLDPGWHHVTNAVLHVLNTLLLFLVLRRATGDWGPSLFVAALFAVHPLRVESVVWIAERKDVLSTFFLMLTLGSYVLYVQRRSRAWYVTAFVCGALGLMAKPMLVTLPVLLLLLDVWPLNRTRLSLEPAARQTPGAPLGWGRLVWEKLPFLFLAFTVGVITFFVQRDAGAVAPLDSVPLALRVGNACVAYATYMWKMVWPLRLGLFYPLHPTLPAWQVMVSVAALTGISALVLRLVRRHAYLGVGWAWYLITLVPAIGLVQVGGQAMADRFTYVPLIGLFIMLAWGVPAMLPPSYRRGLVVGAVACVIGSSAVTREQIRVWKDEEALWRHTLAVTPDSYVALNSLGQLLYARGQVDEGTAHFAAAVRLAPTFPEAHDNLGNALMQRGRVEEAIGQYRAAIQIAPRVAEYHSNLGLALGQAGRQTEAIAELRTALDLNPALAQAHAALGDLLARQGSLDDAIREFREALALNPTLPDARHLFGLALAASGRLDEAIAEYKEALRVEPTSVALLTDLGVALEKRGRTEEAATVLSAATQLAPDAEAPHLYLGFALGVLGRRDEAAAQFEQVLRLNPANEAARTALALAAKRR
jgi:protein O-mannosyl-transferase